MNEDINRRTLLNAETAPPAAGYTSRIQKGGALIEEMRELVRLWTDAPLTENKAEVIRMNPLNKATRARVVDVLNRIFVPRFIEGSIRDSWKLLRPLEDLKASSAVVRPIYFWLTARAEPLVYDFCTDYLASRRRQGLYAVNVTEAAAWVASKSAQWSENVNIKVTRAILAALRDFGVLEGRARKTLSSPAVPLPSFAYIAFCLHQCGVASRNILDHPDWRLFLLDAAAVEHLLLEAHQLRLLEYQAAGSVVNLSFPASTAKEYAHVVLGR